MDSECVFRFAYHFVYFIQSVDTPPPYHVVSQNISDRSFEMAIRCRRNFKKSSLDWKFKGLVPFLVVMSDCRTANPSSHAHPFPEHIQSKFWYIHFDKRYHINFGPIGLLIRCFSAFFEIQSDGRMDSLLPLPHILRSTSDRIFEMVICCTRNFKKAHSIGNWKD